MAGYDLPKCTETQAHRLARKHIGRGGI